MKLKSFKALLATSLAMTMFVACSSHEEATQTMTQSGLCVEKFQDSIDGKQTALYVLKNANGMEVCITNYGGRVVSILVPDQMGEMRDVCLGFDSIQAYYPSNNQTDFGASIGRYANRINKGQFVLDGDTIQLPTNNYGHCLHGGPDGWQYRVYDADQQNDTTLVLTLHSPDGDMNFPGAVDAKVTYTLTSENAIDIQYEATTDKPTIINMTNHTYFNLSGNPELEITKQMLYVNADNYTPVDSTFMTYGTIEPVKGTPMDFTELKKISEGIDSDFEQVQNGHGFDHNWVLNTAGDITQCAARVVCLETGIVLEVYTSEPGLQIYCGNFLDGTVTGKHGTVYNRRTAICLESQHYPDSPNKSQWPSVVLRPGETYTSHCIYKFVK